MASGKPAPSPSSAGLSFPTGPRGAAFSKSPPRPSAPLDPASRGAQAAGATPPTQSQPGDRPLQPGVRTQGPGAETRTSTSARQCGLPARGARPQRRHRAATGWGGGSATVPAGYRLTSYGQTGRWDGRRGAPRTGDPGLRSPGPPRSPRPRGAWGSARTSRPMLGLRPGAGPGGVRERPKERLAPPTASAPPARPAPHPAAAALFPQGVLGAVGAAGPAARREARARERLAGLRARAVATWGKNAGGFRRASMPSQPGENGWFRFRMAPPLLWASTPGARPGGPGISQPLFLPMSVGLSRFPPSAWPVGARRLQQPQADPLTPRAGRGRASASPW